MKQYPLLYALLHDLIPKRNIITNEFWQRLDFRQVCLFALRNRQFLGITKYSGHIVYGRIYPRKHNFAGLMDWHTHYSSLEMFYKLHLDFLKSSLFYKAITERVEELHLLTRNDISVDELFHCRNQEIKRQLVKNMGYDKLKEKLADRLTIMDKQGFNELLRIRLNNKYDLLQFVKVKDASSDRIYLIGVPLHDDRIKLPPDPLGSLTTSYAEIKTVKHAIAWTFDMLPEEYQPKVET